MNTPVSFEALVISAYGRHLLARDMQGQTLRARPFGRSLSIVCGDRVRCERDAHGQAHVLEVLPRSSALLRSNARGASEAIVANLTQVAVVIAAVPRPDFFMVDRYLSAIASAGLHALLIVNKTDLPLGDDEETCLAQLQGLAYRVFRVSARAEAGMESLGLALAGNVSVLVGQSGVGKSSLIRQLTRDGADAVTGELMRATEGRHTTTASRCYDCIGGGLLIDSPGVRDFAPSVDQLEPASLGFYEIQKYASGCRFLDCKHMNEPQCAVRNAVESGQISERRYESYRRLRRLSTQLLDQRSASRRPRR